MKLAILLAALVALGGGISTKKAASEGNYIYGENVINNGDFHIGAGEYVLPVNQFDVSNPIIGGWGTYGCETKVIKEPGTNNTVLVMEQMAGFRDFYRWIPTGQGEKSIEDGNTYTLSFDYKLASGTCDNIGVAFWNGAAGNRLPELNIFNPSDIAAATVADTFSNVELENGWHRVTWQRLFAAGGNFDTMQFWANANNTSIYIDNMSIVKNGGSLNILGQGDFEGFLDYASSGLTTTPDSNGAYGVNATLISGGVSIAADGHYGVTLDGLYENEYELTIKAENTEGATVSASILAGENKLVTEALSFVDGKASAVVAQAETATSIQIEVAAESPTIKVTEFLLKPRYLSTYDPDHDYYEDESMTVNGDFEAFEIGTKFSEAQLEGAWGSVASYDNPARIVEGYDGHAAAIGKHDASDSKVYSSMFLMTPDTLTIGDILRVRFDYKLSIVGDPADYTAINMCFVGGANVSYYMIDMKEASQSVTSGAEKGHVAITSTPIEGAEGWNRVSFDFEITNDIIQWNSIRWLFTAQNEGELLYVDNVELHQLLAEAPSNDATSISITGGDQELEIGESKKLEYTFGPEGADAPTVTWTSSNTAVASVKEDGTVTAIGEGSAEITITTANGLSDSIVVTVRAAEVVPPENNTNKTAIIAGSVCGGVVVLAAIVLIILKKKKVF